MSNKHIVMQYMESYNALNHEATLPLLTDDVEWICPGAFHLRGKDAFGNEMTHHEYETSPQIIVTRMTEEGNIVIAEGEVRAKHKGQNAVHLVFCDVFEMYQGKIKRLTSYLAPA
jgi:uncharacterized protein